MMTVKKNLFLTLVAAMMLISNGMEAQFSVPMEKIKLVFKDGKELKGIGRVSGTGRIKFKLAKGEEASKFKIDDLFHYVTYKGEIPRKYVQIEVERKTSPVIAMEYIKGEASLYVNSYTVHYTGSNLGGFAGLNGGSSSSVSLYFLKLKNFDKAIDLSTNGVFLVDFYKAISLYFKDCPSLIQKVSKENYTLKDIKLIVQYYNSECN